MQHIHISLESFGFNQVIEWGRKVKEKPPQQSKEEKAAKEKESPSQQQDVKPTRPKVDLSDKEMQFVLGPNI